MTSAIKEKDSPDPEAPPSPPRRRENLLFALGILAILLSSHWVRGYVLEKHRFFLPMQSAYGRMQVSIQDADRMLSGVDLKQVFAQTQSIDDKGFSFYCLAVMSLTGLRLGDSSMAEVSSTVLRSIHLLDHLVLLVLIAAVTKVLGKRAAIFFGFFYALFLPIPIYIYWNQAEYVLNAGISLIVLSGFLLLPRSRIGLYLCLVLLSLLSVFSTLLRSSEFLFPIVLSLLCFIKYGFRKGLVMALVFLAPYFGLLAVVTASLDLPRHPIWHAVFVGLGNHPNPYGLQFTDTQGSEESIHVRNKEVNQWRPDPEYFDVMKGRALSLISENPEFWLRLLFKRTIQVIFGEQQWEYYAMGFTSVGARVITWFLFVLSLVGLWLAYRERRQDAVFLLMSQLYHSLIFVPIVPGKSQLYLASSILQGVFAAYALSRLRFGGSSAPAVSEPNWRVNPLSPALIGGAVLTTCLVGAACVALFLGYAARESKAWNAAFLDRMDQFELLQSGKVEEREPSFPNRGLLGGVPQPVVGDAYLFHALCEVERGRIGFGVRDAEGNNLSNPASNSSPGLCHVFVGLIASGTGAIDFHYWDAHPAYLPLVDSLDRRQLETRMELYRHYRVRDHAKREFNPDLRVDVSETSFPNGHEEIAVRMNKHIPAFGVEKIPAYWRSTLPAVFRLALPQPTELSEISVLLPERNVTLEVRYEEAPDDPTLSTQKVRTVYEETPDGVAVRQSFEPFTSRRIHIHFKGERDKAVLVKDISLPDRTEFKVLEYWIRRIEKSRINEGFPTRLSFRDPD